MQDVRTYVPTHRNTNMITRHTHTYTHTKGLSLKWSDDDDDDEKNALKTCDSSSPLRSLDIKGNATPRELESALTDSSLLQALFPLQ